MIGNLFSVNLSKDGSTTVHFGVTWHDMDFFSQKKDLFRDAHLPHYFKQSEPILLMFR
ncbi:Hypothetical protein CpMEX30_0063 [Corynebacterium pseudotuberculosis]|nr:Hypothetical protein CpE19_0060 [Corynebacterium pseudotuberculosis]APG80779.1 hypothetical protein CPI37_0061 [Corynebacterium pseudotuberculosis]APQ53184.1 Hypothetical protein CpMEX30_0063 [Corynebacterium pseudotuberculosis]APQ55237.1 Hypothetical protein CpMEX31_0061 [Corynebacterium pseudotuberculosis]ATB60959.1 Hypothetical protein BFF96_0063 [Corynebacterium pseudotuberculosis]